MSRTDKHIRREKLPKNAVVSRDPGDNPGAAKRRQLAGTANDQKRQLWAGRATERLVTSAVSEFDRAFGRLRSESSPTTSAAGRPGVPNKTLLPFELNTTAQSVLVAEASANEASRYRRGQRHGVLGRGCRSFQLQSKLHRDGASLYLSTPLLLCHHRDCTGMTLRGSKRDSASSPVGNSSWVPQFR